MDLYKKVKELLPTLESLKSNKLGWAALFYIVTREISCAFVSSSMAEFATCAPFFL